MAQKLIELEKMSLMELKAFQYDNLLKIGELELAMKAVDAEIKYRNTFGDKVVEPKLTPKKPKNDKGNESPKKD